MDLELRSVGFVGAGLGAVISVVCSWESNNSHQSWFGPDSLSHFQFNFIKFLVAKATLEIVGHGQ